MGGSIVISKLDQWVTDLLQLMGDAALPQAVMDWQRIVRQCEVPRFIMRVSVPHRCFGLGWLNKGLYIGDLCVSPLLTEHVRLSDSCLSFALIQTNLDFVEDSIFIQLCFLVLPMWIWPLGLGVKEEEGIQWVHNYASENQLLQYLFSFGI